jgi:hypothetical protein
VIKHSLKNAGRLLFLVLMFLMIPFASGDPAAAPLYAENFEKMAEGEVPEQIQVLDGEFVIKKVDSNMVLEMGPDPLKPSGVLFGPADKNEYQISARIKTSATGKRFPEFGVGACGPNEFKLWMMPAVNQLQLLKGDDVEASAPIKWASGSWTKFSLRVSKTGEGKWKIQGKAWQEGQDEPKDWMINFEDNEAPRPGRAGMYCTPYAGTPTEFDDVVVEAVGK